MKWPLPRWEGEGCSGVRGRQMGRRAAGGKEETVTLRKRKVVLLWRRKESLLAIGGEKRTTGLGKVEQTSLREGRAYWPGEHRVLGLGSRAVERRNGRLFGSENWVCPVFLGCKPFAVMWWSEGLEWEDQFTPLRLFENDWVTEPIFQCLTSYLVPRRTLVPAKQLSYKWRFHCVF